LRKFLRLIVSALKLLVVAVVAIEVLAFLLISASNYLLCGQVREGDRVRYDPYALFLNLKGPRATANNPPDMAAPVKTAWLLGGSTMWGATDRDDRTIASYLARSLNRAGRHPVRVVNFGEISFNSLLETKYLQKLLIENSPSAPDLVIFYDGANDCTYFAQHRTPYGHHGYRRLQAMVEGYHRSFFGLLKPLNAAIYSSFTRELYDKFRQVSVPLAPDPESLEKLVAMTAQRYEHVRKLAGCYGAQFLLFWQPILWVETAPIVPEVKAKELGLMVMGERFLAVRHNMAFTYEAMARRLQGEAYFVNFQNVLCPRTEPAYQPDGVHLLDRGRELVAGEMGRVLEERGLNR
jgi:lysophospholipase L1-like esterase